MKILDLYKAILASAGALVDDDGLVSMSTHEGEAIPFRVKEKRLAIPTPELLRQGGFNPDGALIAFHPICENVMLDTSPVLEKFEVALTFRLRSVLQELILQLSAIAVDHSYHKKLKMAQHGRLSAMPNATDRTASDIAKAVSKGSATGPRKLVSLFVRKGGEYGGDKVSRLGKFYPSIIDGLDKEKRTLWDVQLRKADVEDFQTLIEFLLPDYTDPERYSAPSNSPVAPSLQALLKAFYRAANQLNKITELYKDHLDNAEALLIPLEWFDAIQDLSDYRTVIPALPGNDGAEGVKKVVARQEEIARPADIRQSPQAVAQSRASGAKPSVNDLLAGLAASAAQPQRQSRGWGQQRNPNDDLPPWAQPKETNAGWGGNRGGGGGWGGGGGSRGRNAL